MHVTVSICTRNRAASLVTALTSVAALDYHPFDVIVVDQSSSDETEQAIHAMRSSLPQFPPLTYIHSPASGTAVSHNIAIAYAKGELIAFTDDDCEVAHDWLSILVSYFTSHPQVAEVCGPVYAGPHDPSRGFIPTYHVSKERQVASRWLKWREGGIGANMAFRLEALRSAGLFDEMLGTGAPLRAYLDGDMTYRMLRAGYTVASIPDACVTHHGFRTWDEGSKLMHNCSIGIASSYTKQLRLGDVAALPTFLYEWARCISWDRLLLFKRHTGLRRFLAFAHGIALSARYRIDRDKGVYHHDSAAYSDLHVIRFPEAAEEAPNARTPAASPSVPTHVRSQPY